MGGIKLDWDVESERNQHRQQHTEDNKAAKKRHRNRFKILFMILFVFIFLGACGYLLIQRSSNVDAQLEARLRETVDAELASLRIGDLPTYQVLQRSASEVWVQSRLDEYFYYQELKQTDRIQQIGEVVELTISGKRGRVLIKQIIENKDIQTLWFYWHYDDGWYHVPADYDFWGKENTLKSDHLTLNFKDVDQTFASAIVETLDPWLTLLCLIRTCDPSFELIIDVIPTDMNQVGWLDPDSWHLAVPSPLTDHLIVDQPFTFETRLQMANLLSERLVNSYPALSLAPAGTDRKFLSNSLKQWLLSKWLAAPVEQNLFTGLTNQYGDTIISSLLTQIQADDTIQIIEEISATPLPALTIDWIDYLNHLLSQENQAILARDETLWLTYIELFSDDTHAQSYARYADGLDLQNLQVINYYQESNDSGDWIIANLATPAGDYQIEALWHYQNGSWKRVG